MQLVPVTKENREEVNSFISKRWLGTNMAVRGRLVDMTKAQGIAAYDDETLVGLVTYIIEGPVCEIMSLDSVREGQGAGTKLLDAVTETAKEAGCERIVLITTNDNTRAMRFYQRRGFDMAALYRNALDKSRMLKPSIPLTGEDGIPLRHEIEFEYLIQR